MNKPWTDSNQLDQSAGLTKPCISLRCSVVVCIIIRFMFEVIVTIFDNSILKWINLEAAEMKIYCINLNVCSVKNC